MNAQKKIFAQWKVNFPPTACGNAECSGLMWIIPWKGISGRWVGGAISQSRDFWGADHADGRYAFTPVFFPAKRI